MDDHEEDTDFDDIVDTQFVAKNLKIYDRTDSSQPIGEGFTAITVVVDARPASSLVWKTEAEQAENIIERGLKICFELDFGLFGPEFKGISSQGQFQTIVLAIDEFRNRLLNRFKEHVEAVILYRSNTVFSSIEERDIQMDYLDLLRNELPDDTVTLLLFDVTDLQDPYSFARLFSPDRFSSFTLAFTNAPLLLSCACWNQGKALLGYIGTDLSLHIQKHVQEQEKPCTKGLIMPRFTSDATSVKPLLDSLVAKNEHFKLISEDFLALEWDGLDDLYVEKTCLAATTLRMIDGFIAAGGRVVIDQKPPDGI